MIFISVIFNYPKFYALLSLGEHVKYLIVSYGATEEFSFKSIRSCFVDGKYAHYVLVISNLLFQF